MHFMRRRTHIVLVFPYLVVKYVRWPIGIYAFDLQFHQNSTSSDIRRSRQNYISPGVWRGSFPNNLSQPQIKGVNLTHIRTLRL